MKLNSYDEALIECSVTLNDSRCCSVVALALACDIDIGQAYQAMKQQGRQHGQGAYTWQSVNAAKALGFTVERVHNTKAKTVVSAEKHLNKQDNYMIVVNGHILAMRGGEVLDWTKGKRNRIVVIYKVSKGN